MVLGFSLSGPNLIEDHVDHGYSSPHSNCHMEANREIHMSHSTALVGGLSSCKCRTGAYVIVRK